MKHFYSLLVLFLLLGMKAGSQNPITLTDDTLHLATGTVPAFSVVIPETDYETVTKDWIKLLQSGTKSKVVQKGNSIHIFGARVKPVSTNPVNIYSEVTDQNDAVKVRAAFETEKDNFLGKPEFANARKYLLDFGKEQYIAVVNDELSKQKKILRDLQGELNSLERDQARMEKSDKDNAEKITEENRNLADLKDKLAGISDRNAQGDTAVTGMGAPSADEMKDLDKERKRLNRDIRSSEKSIDKAESEIAQNKRDMPRNQSDQEEAKRKVKEQESVVQKVQDKLDKIKSYN
ncbi:MAG TPA: hypothetical protein VK155_08695 [Bacteroidales bacterium]|jgi:hypothetical protein|nr:hypothetical protein [Bacteroidales bacterium]